MTIFRLFEKLIEPTVLPTGAAPPAGLTAFYWHHARQVRHLVGGLFLAGSIVALLDTTIPVFIGQVIALVSSHTPATLLGETWPLLSGMAAVLLIARPVAIAFQHLITNQAINPGFTNLVRWQNHWHV